MKGAVFGMKVGEGIEIKEGVEKKAWNIREALMTPFGTRPCLPRFGSRLNSLRFNLIDGFFLDLCKIYISDAIANSVEGVSVQDIKVEKKERNGVRFDILFKDETTNSIGSYSMSFDNGKWNM